MEYLLATHSDVGIKKDTNQDSLCVKVAETQMGKIMMAVICDGMGGLSKGELASAMVIQAFSQWFEKELPTMLSDFHVSKVTDSWEHLIQEQNNQIVQYGEEHEIRLGTTLSVLLIVGNDYLVIGHVGDSRIYKINNQLTLLTEDQTVVGLEVRKNILTPEEAEKDPRRNVLLQCIGATGGVIPVFIEEKPIQNTVYMLCSDGFRHVISNKEILEAFSPQTLLTEEQMKQQAIKLTELNKARGEDDNISVLLIKTQ